MAPKGRDAKLYLLCRLALLALNIHQRADKEIAMSSAVAGGAAAIAASSAASAARSARVAGCHRTMIGFRPETATTQEIRQYGECARLIYPDPQMDPGMVIIIKIAIVLVFVGTAIGAYAKWEDDLSEKLFGAFFGALFAAGGLFALFLVLSGVVFLFKA